MASTLLSTLLNRMNRYQAAATVEEQYKVRDIDDAIRTLKRSYDLPFFQRKGSLKVFQGVYEYPPASDHDYLIYVDRQQQDLPFGSKLRARYTSMRQFYEDPDGRNQVAEIWNQNALTIGVRDKAGRWEGLASQVLDPASSTTDHTASADASNLAVSLVNFVTGSSSLQFTNTNVTNAATVTDTFTGFTDSNYLSKWYFRWVYFAAVPTSVTLKFGVDASNYLSATVTAQFSGQAFAAGQWNFLAFDLNAATATGTVSTASVFAYEAVTLNTAATGVYYLDASYLKGWDLLDYWYYSKYAVALTGSTVANQQAFFNSSEVYATSSALVGDDEWADCVIYVALMNTLADEENASVRATIEPKLAAAMTALEAKWPDARPLVTTNRYQFGSGVDVTSDPYGFPGT